MVVKTRSESFSRGRYKVCVLAFLCRAVDPHADTHMSGLSSITKNGLGSRITGLTESVFPAYDSPVGKSKPSNSRYIRLDDARPLGDLAWRRW